VVSVVAALEQDVRDLGKLPPACGALVASAFALAEQLDSGSSATSKSMCAKALLDTLDRLRELAPPTLAASPLDEIRERRDKRVRRAS
jgi:hypothetical protein